MFSPKNAKKQRKRNVLQFTATHWRMHLTITVNLSHSKFKQYILGFILSKTSIVGSLEVDTI